VKQARAAPIGAYHDAPSLATPCLFGGPMWVDPTL